MSFIFDPRTGENTPMKIIATREDFPTTAAKRTDLEKVVFPAGIVQRGKRVVLCAGLSDTSVGMKKISNPFEYK
jgi:hypothetical protein